MLFDLKLKQKMRAQVKAATKNVHCIILILIQLNEIKESDLPPPT